MALQMKVISALSPQPGNLYTEVTFKKPVGTLIGSDSSALELRVFPYGFGTFKLTWSEFVTSKEAAEKLKNSQGEKKYHSYREFLNSKVVIGYRTEFVPFFKEKESHPYVVESLSAEDGVGTEIVINIVLKINRPSEKQRLKILELNDPFGYVFGFINEAIVRWANAKSSKEIRKMNPDDTVNPLDEIQIEGRYYLDYLNEKFFSEYDMAVTNINLKGVFLSESSKSVLDAENKVVIAKSGTEQAEWDAKKALIENDVTEKQNETALKFINGQYAAKTNFITKSAQSLKEINQGYAQGTKLTTLVINGEESALSQLLTANIIAEKTKKGGN